MRGVTESCLTIETPAVSLRPPEGTNRRENPRACIAEAFADMAGCGFRDIGSVAESMFLNSSFC